MLSRCSNNIALQYEWTVTADNLGGGPDVRLGGILLLLPTLALVAYALFALGWDGGTQRIWGDYFLLAIAAVMGVGAVGMIARQRWGAYLGLGVLAAMLLLMTAAPLLR